MDPASSQELAANLAMVTSQGSLRGRMVEIAPHGVFPWPDVHPRRHALSGQPPLRAQISRGRRAAGRYELALRLRSSGCRSAAGQRARRVLSHRLAHPDGATPQECADLRAKGPRRHCAGGSRLTPGGGQAMPRASRPLGALRAAPPSISRRAPLRRRGRGSAASAVATPRVAPRPAHAGSRVGPAHGDAIRAVPAVWASTRCLKTGRAEAVAKGVNAARGHFWPPGRSGAGRRRPQGLPWV